MIISRAFSRKNKTLLKEMVRTDFKLRYQGSVLGYAWSFFKPLLLFAILYIIFSKVLRFGENVAHFNMSLLLGIVVWSYFVEATTRSVTSIVERGDLIRKIKIPRYLIVVSTVLSATINFIFSLIVFFVFLLFSDISISWSWLLSIPLLLELFIFILGVSLFLSAVFVKFRDMNHIWEVLVQMAFYATPIIYPLVEIPEKYHQVKVAILFSPIAQIIEDLRWALVDKASNPRLLDLSPQPFWIIPSLIVLSVCIVSVIYFKNQSKYFAENV